MARAAEALGHEYLALTDHSPLVRVANGLDAERLERQLATVAEVNEALSPFRVLTGMEVDIRDDASLDMDEDLLARLDVVVASPGDSLYPSYGGLVQALDAERGDRIEGGATMLESMVWRSSVRAERLPAGLTPESTPFPQLGYVEAEADDAPGTGFSRQLTAAIWAPETLHY